MITVGLFILKAAIAHPGMFLSQPDTHHVRIHSVLQKGQHTRDGDQPIVVLCLQLCYEQECQGDPMRRTVDSYG